MSNDEIVYNQTGDAVGFNGRDAVDTYRYALLSSSLRMYAACGLRPTRGVGITHMLKMASSLTGKKYKRGDVLAAAADLDRWVQEMKAALPSRVVG